MRISIQSYILISPAKIALLVLLSLTWPSASAAPANFCAKIWNKVLPLRNDPKMKVSMALTKVAIRPGILFKKGAQIYPLAVKNGYMKIILNGPSGKVAEISWARYPKSLFGIYATVMPGHGLNTYEVKKYLMALMLQRNPRAQFCEMFIRGKDYKKFRQLRSEGKSIDEALGELTTIKRWKSLGMEYYDEVSEVDRWPYIVLSVR